MKWLQTRNNQIWVVVFIFIALLVGRLFHLTVVQGAEWSEASSNLSVRSVYTVAPRGQILDRYGRLLAGNQASFTVQFSSGDLNDEELNAQALEVARILEANGDEITDDFPIILENGQFYYTYDKQVEEWLLAQNMPTSFTAEEAFNEIRRLYEIDEGLDKYDAQVEMQNKYNTTPPISVVRMKFTYELEKEKFLSRYYLGTKDEEGETIYDISAEEAFDKLRTRFKIDESMSDADARKIMLTRDALNSLGYYKYMPAKIATGISANSIIVLEERSTELSGVEVVVESIREYPNGTSAAHILGYMGKISETEKEEYLEKGYNTSDMIGKEGIEAYSEADLKGTDGITYMEVNASGEKVRTISEEAPVKGSDVYLTIDLELQQTAEEALQKALTGIQTGGSFQSEWGNYNYSRRYPNANVGAAVAIEVKTGEVLALANSESYDPNLFVNGISTEDWQSLQPDNPRDPLAPRPLYNVATRTTVQPGSTFKMVTALAALEKGLRPGTELQDKGYIMYGGRSYGCVVWNDYRSTHGYIDLYTAIEVSCNYYFYDIATGVDWARSTESSRRSLGIGEVGIETISYYAEQFGLGLNTGIEIGDSNVLVPSAEQKTTSTQAAVRNMLKGSAHRFFEESVTEDLELLNTYIEEIVSWVAENPSRAEIIKRLGSTGIKAEQIETVADTLKFDYFNFASFNDGDVMNIAIGQGENSYTPLQMANYIATLGNNGVLNQVNVVRAVEGQGLKEKEAGVKVDISSDAYLDDVIEGMRRVAHGGRGSVRSIFSNFPVKVGAKTGTAQKEGWVPAASEVEYIKENLYRISSSLTWEAVETEMNRLMEWDPNLYSTTDIAVIQAVLNLGREKSSSFSLSNINAYKSQYDNYAWFVAMAPIEDPEIAVAVLIFQGGTAANAAPVAREIIGQYLGLSAEYDDYSISTVMTE